MNENIMVELPGPEITIGASSKKTYTTPLLTPLLDSIIIQGASSLNLNEATAGMGNFTMVS